ncbi:hypothetical protein [Caenimonas sedimenti]|nr:hypothetical protein [Caenimonas sedimenti]
MRTGEAVPVAGGAEAGCSAGEETEVEGASVSVAAGAGRAAGLVGM